MAAVAVGMLGFPGISQATGSHLGSPKIVQAFSKSNRLPITIAGYPFDRVKGLVDGSVQVEGCDTRFEVSNIYKLNAMAMGGNQKFEVQEIGLHPFMLAYANNNFRDYNLIPAFPLRTFRHKSMFIRTDRGINKPEDLRGKTVAAASSRKTCSGSFPPKARTKERSPNTSPPSPWAYRSSLALKG